MNFTKLFFLLFFCFPINLFAAAAKTAAADTAAAEFSDFVWVEKGLVVQEQENGFVVVDAEDFKCESLENSGIAAEILEFLKVCYAKEFIRNFHNFANKESKKSGEGWCRSVFGKLVSATVTSVSFTGLIAVSTDPVICLKKLSTAAVPAAKAVLEERNIPVSVAAICLPFAIFQIYGTWGFIGLRCISILLSESTIKFVKGSWNYYQDYGKKTYPQILQNFYTYMQLVYLKYNATLDKDHYTDFVNLILESSKEISLFLECDEEDFCSFLKKQLELFGAQMSN